jgi:PelA/Pel-15E family pectate lyase
MNRKAPVEQAFSLPCRLSSRHVPGRSTLALPLVALLCAALLPAATIGKSLTPPPLTRARIAALPEKDRAPWLAYLDRSERQMRTDRLALDAELKSAGLARPNVPPSGGGARSIPLDRPAEWYATPDALRIAKIVVSFQTPAGGWSKNLNMADHERRTGEHYAADNVSRYLSPGDFDTPHDAAWSYVGTLDNDATTTQLHFLARVVTALGPKDSAPYRAAFLRGIDYLLAAQYPNGGWPQVWPLEGGYHDAVTFNDGAMIGALQVLQENYSVLPAEVRERAVSAVARGIDCILKSQIAVDGVKTVWGQQHDALTLQPVAARNYEPAALCASESVGIVEFLMGHPHPGTTAAVNAALAWFRKTAIHGQRYARGPEGGRLEAQPGAPALWSRFYEIGNDRPIFGDRDQSIHDDLRDISLERRRGYNWYVTAPQSLLER